MLFNFRAMWTLQDFAQDHNLSMKNNFTKVFVSLPCLLYGPNLYNYRNFHQLQADQNLLTINTCICNFYQHSPICMPQNKSISCPPSVCLQKTNLLHKIRMVARDSFHSETYFIELYTVILCKDWAATLEEPELWEPSPIHIEISHANMLNLSMLITLMHTLARKQNIYMNIGEKFIKHALF